MKVKVKILVEVDVCPVDSPKSKDEYALNVTETVLAVRQALYSMPTQRDEPFPASVKVQRVELLEDALKRYLTS